MHSVGACISTNSDKCEHSCDIVETLDELMNIVDEPSKAEN